MASHGSPARLAMFTISATLPLDSVARMKRRLSRVSPATVSGHGSSRCQARFRSSISASVEPADLEVVEELVEARAVQVVELRPRHLAARTRSIGGW